MPESIHKKLERIRRPRVHITYEVETEGAMVVRELPFVVGVMGHYSGNKPVQESKRLEERKFITIDRDNFNDVMKKIGPGLAFRVENTLAGDGKEMPVELKFEAIEDFEPARVVEQIKPLKTLLDSRNKLRDLMAKADSSQNLEAILEKVLQQTQGEGISQELNQLANELGIKPPATQDSGNPSSSEEDNP